MFTELEADNQNVLIAYLTEIVFLPNIYASTSYLFSL